MMDICSELAELVKTSGEREYETIRDRQVKKFSSLLVQLIPVETDLDLNDDVEELGSQCFTQRAEQCTKISSL